MLILSVHCGNQMSGDLQQWLASFHPLNLWTIMPAHAELLVAEVARWQVSRDGDVLLTRQHPSIFQERQPGKANLRFHSVLLLRASFGGVIAADVEEGEQ